MRILCLQPGPHFSVADVYNGWLRAFQHLGVQVVDFNLSDRLGFYSQAGRLDTNGEFVRMLSDEGAAMMAAKGIEAACYEFEPDVLFVVSCFYVPPQLFGLVRARGTKVVILHTEEPYEHDRQLTRAPFADLNLVNDPIHLDAWRRAAPTEYMPHCYDPDIHKPGPAREECRSDFCFVGTAYPSRVEFLEQVDWAGVDVALAGHWTNLDAYSPLRKFLAHDINVCCDNLETVDLYRASKMSANLYRREAERDELADGWAMTPREVEMAAVGLMFAGQPRGELREVLGMVPTFDTPAELGELVHHYLAHDDARETIAHAARARIADRTFENNARRFLTLAERL